MSAIFIMFLGIFMVGIGVSLVAIGANKDGYEEKNKEIQGKAMQFFQDGEPQFIVSPSSTGWTVKEYKKSDFIRNEPTGKFGDQ